MWRILLQQNPRFRSMHAQLGQHPAWVVRTAILCAVITLAIPMIVIIAAAMLVGLVVFVVLSLIAKLMSLLGLSPTAEAPGEPTVDLRRNVRIVEDKIG